MNAVAGLCGSCREFVRQADLVEIQGLIYCRSCAQAGTQEARSRCRSRSRPKRGGPFRRVWRQFAEARAFVRSLGLKNVREWRAFAKGQLSGRGTLPADIPASPERVYKPLGVWTSWGDWLGIACATLTLISLAFVVVGNNIDKR